MATENPNTDDSTQVKKAVEDINSRTSQALLRDVGEIYRQDGGGKSAAWTADQAKLNAAMQAAGLLPDFQITGVEESGKHMGQIAVQGKDGQKGYINEKGIVVNDDGRVLEATYQSTPDHPQGTTQKYTYNDRGELIGVSMIQSAPGKDGAVTQQTTNWQKQNDGWHQVNDKGEPVLGADGKPVISQATVSVGADGAYTIKNTDGSTETYSLDGSSKVQKADGSYITKNGHGYVTECGSADGAKWEFTYTNDKLTGVKMNGTEMKQNPDGSFSSNGITFNSVDQYGGVDTSGLNPDGTKYHIYQNPDGSRKYFDESSGSTSLYDKNNQLIAQFTSKDGHIETLHTSQGTWTYDKQNGHYHNGALEAKNITSDQWGNISITYMDGHTTYIHPSGNQTSVANPFAPPPAQQQRPGSSDK